MILKQIGTRMAEGWRRLKRIRNDDFEKFRVFFQQQQSLFNLITNYTINELKIHTILIKVIISIITLARDHFSIVNATYV